MVDLPRLRDIIRRSLRPGWCTHETAHYFEASDGNYGFCVWWPVNGIVPKIRFVAPVVDLCYRPIPGAGKQQLDADNLTTIYEVAMFLWWFSQHLERVYMEEPTINPQQLQLPLH